MSLYKKAKEYVKERVKNLKIERILFQGKIDITEYIDFQQVAKDFDLTKQEYEKLIDYSQELTDIAIKKWVKKYFPKDLTLDN